MTSKLVRQTQLTAWLAVVIFFLTPLKSSAITQQPQQFDPSSHLPLLLNNHCSGTRPADNFIGIQVYGRTGVKQSDFKLLQGTSTSWLRNSIVWPQVEETNVAPSQYNWGAADASLRASVDNCVNMIVTIENTPAWAATTGERSAIKTGFLDDYREFVTAVVERYDGDGIADAPNGAVVNYWEFYNEPDMGSEVPNQEGWGNFGAQYAKMLETVYDAVHKANPNAKVVFGGIAYNLFVGENGLFVRNFFDDVLAAGGGQYFDVMNFHYYPFQHNRIKWTQGDGSGLREKYESIKSKMEAAGIGDKPVMLTEISWHSATTNTDYPSNAEYQARRVLELLTQAASLKIKAVIWWPFVDAPGAFAYSTGLVVDGSPFTIKPSYYVYSEAVRRIGDAEFDGITSEATEDNDLEAYRFLDADSNRPFYVAWLNPVAPFHKDFVPTFDDGATQNLQVNGSSADILSKEGTLVTTVKDSDDGSTDGKLTIVVGRSPIYIVIK
jgi:hypothetical protein